MENFVSAWNQRVVRVKTARCGAGAGLGSGCWLCMLLGKSKGARVKVLFKAG